MKVNKSKIILSKKEIIESQSTFYDLGNSKLYDLCKENFSHESTDEILAKTIIIGRTYAASLDRGKNKNTDDKKVQLINDDFYQKKVVPIFKKSMLDSYLAKFKNISTPKNHIEELLSLHYYLDKMLSKINGQTKRSFSSKYLHFHLPNLFFMYDSRANSVINDFIIPKDVEYYSFSKADITYAKFYSKAVHLQKKIQKEHGVLLTPRQIDNLFLKNANHNLRNRKNK